VSEPVTPMEANGRAAVVNELLRQIAHPSGALTEWWNHTRYEQLGEHRPPNRFAVGPGQDRRLYAWAETEDPPYSVWRRVERRVLALDATPWQWPSAPLSFATGDPWEIRAAVVPETDGVEVVYEHETGVVNLLRIGR
jgi:hypothetical protein